MHDYGNYYAVVYSGSMDFRQYEDTDCGGDWNWLPGCVSGIRNGNRIYSMAFDLRLAKEVFDSPDLGGYVWGLHADAGIFRAKADWRTPGHPSHSDSHECLCGSEALWLWRNSSGSPVGFGGEGAVGTDKYGMIDGVKPVFLDKGRIWVIKW